MIILLQRNNTKDDLAFVMDIYYMALLCEASVIFIEGIIVTS